MTYGPTGLVVSDWAAELEDESAGGAGVVVISTADEDCSAWVDDCWTWLELVGPGGLPVPLPPVPVLVLGCVLVVGGTVVVVSQVGSAGVGVVVGSPLGGGVLVVSQVGGTVVVVDDDVVVVVVVVPSAGGGFEVPESAGGLPAELEPPLLAGGRLGPIAFCSAGTESLGSGVTPLA